MAFGMRCDTCGADAPSLGSLQMHQLRYHPASTAAANAITGPFGSAAPSRNGRRVAVAPLAVAIGGLLSAGAFAVTIRLMG
jgi:hypothetical protein